MPDPTPDQIKRLADTIAEDPAMQEAARLGEAIADGPRASSLVPDEVLRAWASGQYAEPMTFPNKRTFAREALYWKQRAEQAESELDGKLGSAINEVRDLVADARWMHRAQDAEKALKQAHDAIRGLLGARFWVCETEMGTLGDVWGCEEVIKAARACLPESSDD